MESSPTTLIFTVIALIFVLILAWALLRALSRFSPGSKADGRIQILQTVPLGPRERLVLVRFDADEFLLGVSSGGINVVKSRSAVIDQV